MKKVIILNLLLFISLSYLFSQTHPFPQNKTYPYGYKSSAISANTIRNAYSTWKNSFLRECNGMYRVCGDIDSITISEGMGYGMLLTAYFGEKEYFDGFLEFYKSKRTSQAYNFMGWRVTCDDIIDQGSATDGDLDVAFALIVAHYQWGESYLDEAKNIIAILKEHYFVNCEGVYTMKPGGHWGGCDLTDISYYSPAYFRLFAEVSADTFWNTMAEDAYTILENGANDTTGLVPDWQSCDGVPGGNPPSGRIDYYRYDACRTPWRIALDYLWNGNVNAQNWCIKITNFANAIGAASIVDGYNLDGAPRGQFNNSAFVGGFAVGAMCNSQAIVNNFAGRLLVLNGYDNNYFNLSLRCLYMLVLTGNFWIPGTTPTVIEKTGSLPEEFNLQQNYPNPFNPSTTIKYFIYRPITIKLSIFNLLGQEIETLVNAHQSIGEYKINWNTEGLPSGVYFCRIGADKYSATKKLILQK
jgi:endo-1,4-beta-D-glucanase Y